VESGVHVYEVLEDARMKYVYQGVQSDRRGQTCEVFRRGLTISRIRFADGYETVAFNTDLREVGR